jgi:cytochrome c oxidase subunit 2
MIPRLDMSAGMLAALAVPARAAPRPWQFGFPDAASPVVAEIGDLHRLILYVSVAVFVLLLAVLVWVLCRFNRRVHPVAVRREHGPMLQAAAVGVPAIVLVVVAIPALKLVYAAAPGPADVTVAAIARGGYWTYAYPKDGNFAFDSHKGAGMTADRPLVVPAGRPVEVLVTAENAIQDWSVPELGVDTLAVPGRTIRIRFTAGKPGLYTGLTAFRGAVVPVAVRAVAEEQYESWRFLAQARFAPPETP